MKTKHQKYRKKILNQSILTGIGLLTLTQFTPSIAYADDSKNATTFLQARPSAEAKSFTRMFPDLPPFAEATDKNRELAKMLGQKGGILDAQDQLDDPILSITNPGPINLDNPNMTAGVTFVGQFLDHDITLDARSQLQQPADPRKTANTRTAAFDLDSVYGGGPKYAPELYDFSSGYYYFKIEAIPGSEAQSKNGVTRYDLPRDKTSFKAIIAEARNDEHLILSQLHLAMLRFHNAVTTTVRKEHKNWSPDRIFDEARQQVTWHYQWIIIHEFLPITIGQDRIDYLIKHINDHDYNDGEVKIPIEFSVAAYRFGHSQVRPSYRANFGPDQGPAKFAFVFNDSLDPGLTDPADLRGGKRAPSRFIDWQTFFKFDATNFRPNKRIDTHLSSILMNLPGSRAPSPGLPSDGVVSLASRNLMRHVNFGLPSGQAIAKKVGLPVLSPMQLSELSPYGWTTSTPLWYYILKEAEVMEAGLRLGPVGSYIVGKVFIDLFKADDRSYINEKPDWKPWLPAATAGKFEMTDLLKFAGVVHPLTPANNLTAKDDSYRSLNNIYGNLSFDIPAAKGVSVNDNPAWPADTKVELVEAIKRTAGKGKAVPTLSLRDTGGFYVLIKSAAGKMRDRLSDKRGTYQFSYKITKNGQASAPATVTLNVY